MRYTWFLLLVFLLTRTVWPLDHIVFERHDKRNHVSGRLIVKAQDGSLLLQTIDGYLWAIQPHELVRRSNDDSSFTPDSALTLSEKLLAELSSGYEVHQTAHYLICHNTSREYAQWCGGLFERLHRAFRNYWERRDFPLHKPEFPLVALVFKDKVSYEQYAGDELGESLQSIIGYYSLRTNRVTMYDLTGIESLRANQPSRWSVSEINRRLASPETERTVATIIHEATHQIAFNCGMHARFADIPLWVSEGIAMYFETPDLKSSRGWRNIGGVNHVRLNEFRKGLSERTPDSLTLLIADNQRFRQPNGGLGAYPESWALVYFLIRNRPKEFQKYLQQLSTKRPMIVDDQASRLADFKEAFGKDLDKLDAKFLRGIGRIR